MEHKGTPSPFLVLEPFGVNGCVPTHAVDEAPPSTEAPARHDQAEAG